MKPNIAFAPGFDVGVTTDDLVAYNRESQFRKAFLANEITISPKNELAINDPPLSRTTQFRDAFVSTMAHLPPNVGQTLVGPVPDALEVKEVEVSPAPESVQTEACQTVPIEPQKKGNDSIKESNMVQPKTIELLAPLDLSGPNMTQDRPPRPKSDRPILTIVRKSPELASKQAVMVDKFGQIQIDQDNALAINIYTTVPSAPPIDLTLLDQAKQKLATLPTDTIPKTAPLPQNSRMVLKPNPFFLGRNDEFFALAKALKAGKTVVISQVDTSIIGNRPKVTSEFGGIGKTQLASEFVHRYGQYFLGGVFWLNFAEPASIPVEIVASGGPLTAQLRADFRNLLLEEQMRLVLSMWRSPLPRLLIFDNCEDQALLNHWLPPKGGARVLVTSRQAYWQESANLQVLRLDVFHRRESTALLRQYRPDPLVSETDLENIAAQLGDLPLALHLAGSFLVQDRQDNSVADYLAQLRRANSSKSQADVSLPTHHDRYIWRAFFLNYNQLNTDDPVDILAQVILFRAAYFASGSSIPRDLLLATLNYGSSKRGHDFWGKLRGLLNTSDLSDPSSNLLRQAKEAIVRLVELGLLESVADSALWLHPLLSSLIRQMSPSQEAQAAVKNALLEISELLKQAGSPVALLTWQPHIYAMSELLQQYDEQAQTTGLPADAFSYHLVTSNDYSWERLYYERALAISEEMFGENHPYTAQSLDNLGTLLSFQGDDFGGRFCFERALAIRLAALGENDPETAKSFNNLGALLDTQGDYAGAKRYYEQAIAIRERILGEQHADTAQSLNNWGELLYKQEQPNAAKSYLERALAINENILGKNHPDTARVLNNLGAVLESQANYADARSVYEQAFIIFRTVLGKENVDTATALNNLATLLVTMNNYKEARVYYEEALSIRSSVFGDKHPETAASLHNLAILSFYEGKRDEATDLMSQALKIRELAFGPRHPLTESSSDGLATIKGSGAKLRQLTDQLLQTLPKAA